METVQIIIEGGILVTLVFIGGVLVSIKKDTSAIAQSTTGGSGTGGDPKK